MADAIKAEMRVALCRQCFWVGLFFTVIFVLAGSAVAQQFPSITKKKVYTAQEIAKIKPEWPNPSSDLQNQGGVSNVRRIDDGSTPRIYAWLLSSCIQTASPLPGDAGERGRPDANSRGLPPVLSQVRCSTPTLV